MKITSDDRKQLKRVLKDLGRKKTKQTIFYDLCFCLCAPQTTFKNNIKVIAELKKEEFYDLPLEMFTKCKHCMDALKETLKPVRFYNNKARYLIEAKENFNEILLNIKKVDKDDCGYAQREWLVKNVKGLGMKAASHFLRNLGYDALAIIDTHIIKFMANREPKEVREELIKEYRKSVTKSRGYEMLEMSFQCLAGKYKMTTAELDALVWKKYSNTNWEDFTF